jgi:DNA-binding transcriptional regulator YbjK
VVNPTTSRAERYRSLERTGMATTTADTTAEAQDGRSRILRATMQLVGREGVGALTNRRIAAAASLSLGSLTYHFPSQEQLLRETLALYVEEEVARLEAIATELRERCPSPEELAAEIQKIAAVSVGRPEVVAELELHLHAARDPALQEASRRTFQAYENLAGAALAAMAVPDPERHAVSIVALLMGFGVKQRGTGRQDAGALVEGLRAIVVGAYAEGRREDRSSQRRQRQGTDHDQEAE